MEIDGSSITLAFSLTALEELTDPTDVFDGAERWSSNLGILTDGKAVDVTNFAYDYQLALDFTSGPRDLETSLEESFQMLPTDRHIFIGTTEEQKEFAEGSNWEFLHVEEAATAAEWELVGDERDIEYDGELLEVEEQIEDNSHLRVPVNTIRWHQVNRGEKEWLVRGVDEEFNTESVTEDRVALLHRGVGEGHKLWAVIQETATFESVSAVIEEIPSELIRPHANDEEHADEEGIAERIKNSIGDADEYIAFRVETVDPEQNPELLEIDPQ